MISNSQNIHQRQTNQIFLRQPNPRKHSPINHLIQKGYSRINQQIKEKSSSLSTTLTTHYQHPRIIQSTEQIKRFSTEINSQSMKGSTIQNLSALKMFSSKPISDQQQNTIKFSSFIQERVNDQSIYLKTFIRENQENEKEFNQSVIAYKNILFDKDQEIRKLQEELKQLKQDYIKYEYLEKRFLSILKQNEKLKLQILAQQTEINILNHSQPFTQSREQSDYVSALSDQDKLKLKTLLECQ
ncbi:unnamed protein product [Paramecium sonneborni]|uniref:Uncharacterized protein n=1 Tax=Paramecium sonneborni TaxID=65129 RepID=A0A8S1QBU8_9CILI|nr:unnamed protein product [Paramecium sonneborni]